MLRHFPGLQKLSLFAGDMVILAISSYAAVFLVSAYHGVMFDMDLYINILMIMSSVVGYLLVFDGLLSLRRKLYSEVFIELAILIVKMFVIMMVISFSLRDFAHSRNIITTATVIQFVALALWYRLCWQLEYNDMIPRRILIMGGVVNDCHNLVFRLHTHSYLKDRVRYVCLDYESGKWKEYMDDVDVVILCSDMPLQHKAAMLHYWPDERKTGIYYSRIL